MSWQPANDAKPGDKFGCDAIDIVIVPRARDLGSSLPSQQRQMIGPFVFFDQMGPAEFLLGAGMDVKLSDGGNLARGTRAQSSELAFSSMWL